MSVNIERLLLEMEIEKTQAALDQTFTELEASCRAYVKIMRRRNASSKPTKKTMKKYKK